MNLRSAALLVAVGAGCNFLYGLASVVPFVVRGQIPLRLASLFAPIGFLCFLLAQAIFFAFLFAEGSRRAGNHARATAALAAAVLVLIQAACAVWGIGSIISTCAAPDAHCNFSVPVAVAESTLFGFLACVGWAVFYASFAERVQAFRSNAIPKLAVLLAIIDIVNVILIFLAPGAPMTPGIIVQEGISFCTEIALLVFAVVLYRRWDSRKPVHDIILEGTPERNPRQST